MYIDSLYLFLILPTLILSLWAQVKVQSTFRKYAKVPNSRGISGAQMASYILKVNGIDDVRIGHISGSLTDHYSPSEKVLRLSRPVFDVTTVSAIGVAAHECGHAIQHKKKYGPLILRSTLVPMANIGSAIGPTLTIIGIIFSFGVLIDLGILLFSAAVGFYLITLPVEINASTRAVSILRSSNLFTEEELKGVKKVLTAAALTYVASALTAIMNLLRLILISKDRD